MIERINLCGGSSPKVKQYGVVLDLAQALESAKALKALDAPRIVDGEAGRKADVREDAYREKAADPRLVCIKRAAGTWIAFVEAEPATREEWERNKANLGHGGQGWALEDLFGELAITHNLWSSEFVPLEYAHLFEANTLRASKLTLADEAAHWRMFNPFTEDRRAA